HSSMVPTPVISTNTPPTSNRMQRIAAPSASRMIRDTSSAMRRAGQPRAAVLHPRGGLRREHFLHALVVRRELVRREHVASPPVRAFEDEAFDAAFEGLKAADLLFRIAHRLERAAIDGACPEPRRHVDTEELRDAPHLTAEIRLQVVVVHEQLVLV